MTLRLRGRDRRALLLGATVIAPMIVFRFAVLPFTGALGEARDRLATERMLFSRESAVVAEAPGYPTLVQEAAALLAAQSERLFGGPDELSAAAAVVNHVGTEARKYRVLVQQSETRSAQPAAPGVVTLQISVRGQSDLQGLLGWLYALEGGTKLIRVDQLEIRQSQGATSQPPRDEEVLSFSAVVSGFALGATEDADDPVGMSTIGEVP